MGPDVPFLRGATQLPLDLDLPAPEDIFAEWVIRGDYRDVRDVSLDDWIDDHGEPDGHCRCDWSFHRGRYCGNPLLPGKVITEPQLCTPCLYSCEAEREESMKADRA